jgi:hypothetical protein
MTLRRKQERLDKTLTKMFKNNGPVPIHWDWAVWRS